jgi:hypothetical protein
MNWKHICIYGVFQSAFGLISMNLFEDNPPIRVAGYRRSPAVTIRWATPDDAPKLAILAESDEASVPPAPLLVAFVGDELWVALSLSTGMAISDPFRPSAEVAALALERGRQLTASELGRPRSRLRRLRRRWAARNNFDARNLPRLGRETS